VVGSQHKSRQVQKETGINVDSEKNKGRHAIGTKGHNSLIIYSANREHQAQENVYAYFFIFWHQPLGFWQIVSFPIVLF